MFKTVSNNLNSFEIMYVTIVTFWKEVMPFVSLYGYKVISTIVIMKYIKSDIYFINDKIIEIK